VLSGSTISPSRSPGLNGNSLANGNGPTAAQVLQAPPPRKDSRDSSPHSVSRDLQPNKENGEVNGTSADVSHEPVLTKRQYSFGAVTNGVPDVGKEVSVTA